MWSYLIVRKSYVRIEQNDHIDKADVENNLKSHLNLWRRHNNGNAHSDLTFHNF